MEANAILIRCLRRAHPFCSCTYAEPWLSCERAAARSCCVLLVLSVSFRHSSPSSGRCGLSRFVLLRPCHSRRSLCFDACQFPSMPSIICSFSPSLHSNSPHINTWREMWPKKKCKQEWNTELFRRSTACIIQAEKVHKLSLPTSNCLVTVLVCID